MRPGEAIDHYRLERVLGVGTFATVWLARDELLDDPVAIKVLADNWARRDDVRQRFIAEAKVMRRIDHERIVRVFTVGELPSGVPMLVMTYADRGTLDDRTRSRPSGRFDAATTAMIMVELAECLGIVHDFGIVHRDLKPSNVLFRSPRQYEQLEGQPDAPRDVMVLGDFGLARDTLARSGFTAAAGTPAYMPPEQTRTTSELDHRADIFSATAIMFELLVGEPPYAADTLGDVERAHREPVVRLSSVRADLQSGWQHLLDTGLAIDPDARFQSADELAGAVREVADREPPPKRAARTTRRAARTPPTPLMSGLRGRVATLLDAFEAERSADVDQRLAGPCRLGILGAEVAIDGFADGTFEQLPLSPHDIRVGSVDVLVGTPDELADAQRSLVDAPAGPIAMLAVDDGSPGVSTALLEALGTVERRSDVVRASSALALLDADVRHARSVTLSGAWMRIADDVERLRFDTPEIEDLAALRDDVAGRTGLPPVRSADLRRVLFSDAPAVRVDVPVAPGTASGPPRDVLVDRALSMLTDWRTYQGSGRVPFTARGAVDVVVRSLERLWASLQGYES